MYIDIAYRTPDTFGSNSSIGMVGAVLSAHPLAPGEELAEIEGTLSFRPTLPVKGVLMSFGFDYMAMLAKLPSLKYFPAKRMFSFGYESRISTAQHLASNDLSYQLFADCFEEFERFMVSRESQLRKKKGLPVDRLIAWIRAARDSAPKNLAELESALAMATERFHAEQSQRSPWDIVNVDWSDYHPDARDLLDEPFYWDCVDEFAPHGNDTGADLLESARTSKTVSTAPIAFLERLLSRWRMRTRIAEAIAKPVNKRDSKDDSALALYNDASIALPFAMLKLQGSTDRESVDLALRALDRKVAALTLDEVGTERAIALERMRAKLLAVASSDGGLPARET